MTALRDAVQLYNNERSYAWSVIFGRHWDLNSLPLPALKGTKHSLFVESRLARPAFQPPFNASVPQKLHLDIFTPTMSLVEQLATGQVLSMIQRPQETLHVIVPFKDNCVPLRVFLSDLSVCSHVNFRLIVGDLGTTECDVKAELAKSGVLGEVTVGHSEPGQWCRSRALNTALSAVPPDGLVLVVDAGMRIPCSLLENVEYRVLPRLKVWAPIAWDEQHPAIHHW